MKPQLNLFGILEFLDLKSFQVREAVGETPEELKEIDRNAGWFLPQWMTGAQADKDHVRLVLGFNDTCNVGWHRLARHPELQLKLLATIGSGRKVKHRFFKPVSNPQSDKFLNFLQEVYQDINQREINFWLSRNDEDALVELLEQAGYQRDDRDEIVKSYKSLRGSR